ncbi:hypothetical protein NU768_000857 [Vibrio vulnificus]|nr:hypothetical protein [Vibrio vulnificus]
MHQNQPYYYRNLLEALDAQNIRYEEHDDYFLVFGKDNETPIEVFTTGNAPDEQYFYFNPAATPKRRNSKKQVSERTLQKRAAKAAKLKHNVDNLRLIEHVTAVLNGVGLKLKENNDEGNRNAL